MKDFLPEKWKLGEKPLKSSKKLSIAYISIIELVILVTPGKVPRDCSGCPSPGKCVAFGIRAAPAPGVCTMTKSHTHSCPELGQAAVSLETFAVISFLHPASSSWPRKLFRGCSVPHGLHLALIGRGRALCGRQQMGTAWTLKSSGHHGTWLGSLLAV